MKYIFVAGAPGSKWSSVVKNIYYSPSIDRSDSREERTYYYQDAAGKRDLMHSGVYFDPGLEFDIPEVLEGHSRAELEARFDAAFAPDATGIRIIKSHIFCNNLDFLRRVFYDCRIVLVYRGDDACLGWWVKCGGFDITYPRYDIYYKNFQTMAQHIARQNAGIDAAWWTTQGREAINNRQLAEYIGIEPPPPEYVQDYRKSDVRVKVI